jgi:hypothetical protein
MCNDYRLSDNVRNGMSLGDPLLLVARRIDTSFQQWQQFFSDIEICTQVVINTNHRNDTGDHSFQFILIVLVDIQLIEQIIPKFCPSLTHFS